MARESFLVEAGQSCVIYYVTYMFSGGSGAWPTTTGIYAIKGLYNEFHLVGQTLQPMHKRWTQHRQKLRQDKHDNPYLQNAFNKHGENEFVFLLLEQCEADGINQREIFWIQSLRSMKCQNGWNLREGGAFGLYGPELRKKVSEGIRNSPKALASRLARAKTYCFQSPNGETVKIVNLRKFCRDNKLHSGYFFALLNGKILDYKGWKKI